MNLQDILNFLDENAPNTFLATLGTCGNPRLRPFHSPLLYEGKIYFCTSNEKNLYKHIQKHSGIELCSCAKDMTFLRLRGEAIFEDNLEVKRMMFEKFPITKHHFEFAENPKFAVFYLQNLSARKQAVDGSFQTYKA